MAPGPFQILFVLCIFGVIFSKEKISGLLGDIGTGISEFKKTLNIIVKIFNLCSPPNYVDYFATFSWLFFSIIFSIKMSWFA